MKNFWKKINRPILALAPMAGITDSAFRQICAEFGADVTYSEMASATALFFNPKATLELVKFGEEERPYIVQLFGKEPEHFGVAAKIISGLKNTPDGIDINFGCPAKKVFGHGSGCAIMNQKKLAREIISAVCNNTDLPVSIKIRAGIKDMDAVKFVENTKDLPYSAIMIHGRTYEGSFSGAVNFEICEEIKKIVPDKIVLGNGGIMTPEEGVKILHDYPLLDGLGIARGAWGRPWIFQEIKEALNCHPELVSGSIENKNEMPMGSRNKFGMTKSVLRDKSDIKQIMIHHAQLIHKNKGKKGLFEIRKHMCWYIKGFPGAAELRRRLVMASSVKEIKQILK